MCWRSIGVEHVEDIRTTNFLKCQCIIVYVYSIWYICVCIIDFVKNGCVEEDGGGDDNWFKGLMSNDKLWLIVREGFLVFKKWW